MKKLSKKELMLILYRELDSEDIDTQLTRSAKLEATLVIEMFLHIAFVKETK